MRIGIDCRMVLREESSLGRYAFNLLKALTRLDQENTYVIFVRNENVVKCIPKGRKFQIKVVPTSPFSISEQFQMPYLLKRKRIDLYHSFLFGLPLAHACSSIMTIYDLVHLIFADVYPWKLRLYYRTILRVNAKRAKRIITVSESSKRDIVRFLRVPAQKVEVVYAAVAAKFRQIRIPDFLKVLREKYNVRDKFILSCGDMKFHKNFLSLIKAYSILRNKGMINHKLVICGAPRASFPKLKKKATECGLENQVIFTGLVPDEQLALLYNAADLFILPSLYEGFGLPPLEAMACSTPVVASNVSSLPEILGDAAYLVNPYDIQGLAQAMHEVLSNQDLYKNLMEKGRNRSRDFSWINSGRKLLDIYRQVLKENYK